MLLGSTVGIRNPNKFGIQMVDRVWNLNGSVIEPWLKKPNKWLFTKHKAVPKPDTSTQPHVSILNELFSMFAAYNNKYTFYTIINVHTPGFEPGSPRSRSGCVDHKATVPCFK
jgi:hypothetical protein